MTVVSCRACRRRRCGSTAATTRRIERGFAQFEAWRDETLEQEERDRHKLDRKIAMEEDWLRHGVSARRKRNQGRLEGLQATSAASVANSAAPPAKPR